METPCRHSSGLMEQLEKSESMRLTVRRLILRARHLRLLLRLVLRQRANVLLRRLLWRGRRGLTGLTAARDNAASESAGAKGCISRAYTARAMKPTMARPPKTHNAI